MARRGMAGQLNMFDFFSTDAPGEVEMVSLVPDFDEEPVAEEIPVVEEIPEVEEVPVVEEIPEVEEVPVVEEILEVEEEPGPEKKQAAHTDSKVAMSRTYVEDGIKIEIAYINYNKVRITRGDQVPVIKEFATTKEAVDYYVEQMQELEADE